ncbi:MAG: hypothetical protein ACLPX7_16530 [Xanthobacteraceae bacterium]
MTTVRGFGFGALAISERSNCVNLAGVEGAVMPENRKLAAILAADVVGYSRLAGMDEDRTLARLRTLRGTAGTGGSLGVGL